MGIILLRMTSSIISQSFIKIWDGGLHRLVKLIKHDPCVSKIRFVADFAMKIFFLVVFFLVFIPELLGKNRFYCRFRGGAPFFLVFTLKSVEFCACFAMKTFVFWSSSSNSRKQSFWVPPRIVLCPPPPPPPPQLRYFGAGPVTLSALNHWNNFSCRDPTGKFFNGPSYEHFSEFYRNGKWFIPAMISSNFDRKVDRTFKKWCLRTRKKYVG